MVIIDSQTSKDNKIIKFLQETDDHVVTETAFIEEKERLIICFSSQLGCPIGCTFCYNGVHKNYHRNLTKDEIITQVSNVVQRLNLTDKAKPILFSCMGIGEPLLNYNNVISAINSLNKIYPHSKFALATTGVKPDLIEKLGYDLEDIENFKLTISMHAPNDELRKRLIPIDMSLKEIKKAVQHYKLLSQHKVEWNYVLLNSINDSEENAQELVYFLNENDNLKISSFNEIEGSQYTVSVNLEPFRKIIEDNKIQIKIFNSTGDDMEIGCGQMKTHYDNEINVVGKQLKKDIKNIENRR